MKHLMPGSAGHVLQRLSVTLAIVSGPLIVIGQRLTQSSDAGAGGFSLAQAMRGALCVLLFVPLFVARQLPVLTHRLVRPLLFLAVCAVVTAPAGPYPYENLVFAVKIAFLVLLFANVFHLAARRQFGTRELAICAWALLLIMALSTGAGLATGLVFTGYQSRYATAGLIGQPMEAASLLLSALPVFLSLAPQRQSAVAGLLLLFACLFFTMCRSPLIAGAGATGGAFLTHLRTQERQVQRRAVLAFCGILLLLAGLGFGTGAGVDLLARFRELDPGRGTGSGRYIFWRISLEHIRERPLHVQVLGEGMGSIRGVMEQRFGMAIGSHNDWLDFVNSFGLCGLVGISWWYGELARFTWRLRGGRDGRFQGACAVGIMLALISIGIGGVFDPCWALSYAALGLWAGAAAQPFPDPTH